VREDVDTDMTGAGSGDLESTNPSFDVFVSPEDENQ
jgi:hypothetical protein